MSIVRALAHAVRPRPLPTSRGARALTLLTLVVGAALCCAALLSVASWTAPLAVGVLAAVLRGIAAVEPTSGLRRASAWVAWIALALMFAGWGYVGAVAFALLGWAAHGTWLVLAIFALIVALAARDPRWKGARPSLALPMGIVIAACLSRWTAEEAQVRCDDYLAAIAQPGVELVVPTSRAILACAPGERVPIARYPRRVWESPDQTRVVLTTGAHSSDALRAPGDLTGSICEAPLDGSSPPICTGRGKGHGIVEAAGADRLFAMAWLARFGEGLDGALYAWPRDGSLRDAQELPLPRVGDGVYDARTDTLLVYPPDDASVAFTFRARDLARGPDRLAPISAGQIRFEPERGEGVLCGALGPLGLAFVGGTVSRDTAAFLATAIRMEPYGHRRLGTARDFPSAWLTLSWGCDWDPETRAVHVVDATLGRWITLDYDTGRVQHVRWIGPGARPVTLDRARGIVYVGNFLRGDVRAFDVDSGRVIARWRAGRFVRDIVLGRDGDHLLVTSNLGILRIASVPSLASPSE